MNSKTLSHNTSDPTERTMARLGGASTSVLAAVLAGLLVFAASYAGAATVAVDPTYVTLTSPNQSVTVKVTVDGKPLPASAIKGTRFMASDHNYSEMIVVTRGNGELRIAPSKSLEVGSYTLEVKTNYGVVNVEVLAPLTELPDTLEKQAAAMGITVDELKAKMGLSHKMARETLTLNLPPSYTEGQTLDVALDANPKRVFIWSVNDKVIKQGPGEHTFSYNFENPGKYTLKVEEKEGDVVVAAATATTDVSAQPPIRWDATVADSRVIDAPAGYARYTWFMNGKRVSDGPVLKLTFTEAGKYTIECRADEPKDKATAKSRRVVYEVTVKAVSK